MSKGVMLCVKKSVCEAHLIGVPQRELLDCSKDELQGK